MRTSEGTRIVQIRKAGETDRRDAEGERVGGNADDSQIAGDVIGEGIVAQDLCAAAAPVQLRAFHHMRGPVVRKAERDGLAQRGLRAGRIQKIAKRILPLGIQVVAAIQAELGIDGVQHVEIQNVVVDRHRGLQQIVLHRAGQIRHADKTRGAPPQRN